MFVAILKTWSYLPIADLKLRIVPGGGREAQGWISTLYINIIYNIKELKFSYQDT